jgi:hypothetical protein
MTRLTRLIGLSGKAESGKDTVARLIMNHVSGIEYTEWQYQATYRNPKYQVSVYGFADPIYKMLSTLTGKPVIWLMQNKDWVFQGKTVRQLLQTLGTEWGREMVNEDLWINLIDVRRKENRKENETSDDDIQIIVDIRRENEAAYVRSNGGEVWHIYRGVDIDILDHTSEKGIEVMGGDKILLNYGSIEELNSKIIYEI